MYITDLQCLKMFLTLLRGGVIISVAFRETIEDMGLCLEKFRKLNYQDPGSSVSRD